MKLSAPIREYRGAFRALRSLTVAARYGALSLSRDCQGAERRNSALSNAALTLCIPAGVAIAQAPPRPGQSSVPAGPPKKPGSVAGTVTNSVTGEAIKKATVTLHSFRQRIAYVAVSDAEGHFRMASVEPDSSYTVTAACPGFTPEQMPSRPIPVNEEQAVTGVSVKLSPLGIIAGKVLNEDGDPLSGVSVQAMQVNYQMGARQMRLVRSVQTDDRGEYRLFDLPVGRTFVTAILRDNMNMVQMARVLLHSDQPEQQYPATFYPAATDMAGATPTPMIAGAEVGGIDFHLHKVPVYHIRGRAVDAQSKEPVHGVSLTSSLCAFRLENMGLQKFVPLQPDGTFDISGAVPGLYCLRVQQSQPGHSSFAQQTVSVAGKDVDDVVVSVAPGGDMPGTVLFEGAPPDNFKNFRVLLLPVDGPGSYPNALVKPDNTFVLPDVFPIPYELQQMPAPPGFYLKSIQYGERDASDGRLNVTAAGTPLTLVLASDSAPVLVTVQSPEGSPALGVTVVLAPGGRYALRRDLIRFGYIAPNGSSTIPGVAPGEYKIFAWADVDQNLAQVPEFRKLLESRAGSVTVGPNVSQSVQVQIIPAELVNEAKSKLQ